MSQGSFSAIQATSTGSDAVLTVPAGQKWIIRTVEADLNTSAQVANRRMAIASIINSLEAIYVFCSFIQTASTHIYYAFAPSLPTDTALIDVDIRTGFPEVYLGPGDKIQTGILGIQSGDVANIIVNYEAFLL